MNRQRLRKPESTQPRDIGARAGTLNGLTGIDDPYEPPESPDLVLDALLEEHGLR